MLNVHKTLHDHHVIDRKQALIEVCQAWWNMRCDSQDLLDEEKYFGDYEYQEISSRNSTRYSSNKGQTDQAFLI